MRILRGALPFLYLLALAAGSAWLADSSWRSVTSYRSEYALDRRFEAAPPLASRVVMVVFDGLRTDRATALPVFSELASRGAHGTLRTTVPSLSNPARAALVTGAWPEVSGVTNNSSFEPVPVQSLFGLARDRGLRAAAFGTRFWLRAFGSQLGGDFRRPSRRPGSYEAAELAAWQAETCSEAASFLGESTPSLAVIGLLAGDDAGHEFGGLGPEYGEVALAVDRCVGRLVAEAGSDATFIVVSDHGHIDRWGKGGHGGVETEVIIAPFAMAGPGVLPSGPLAARIVDFAPTVSLLLGLPIPANSQGEALWGALDVPAGRRGALRELQNAQRDALAAHLPDRQAALAAQRRHRLPLALAALAWFLVLAALAVRGARMGRLAVAAACFAILFPVAAYCLQVGVSISSVVRQEYLYSFFIRLIGSAAVAFLAAAAVLVRGADRPVRDVARLALVLTGILASLVTVTYYWYGLRMDGWMIEIGPVFVAYLGLLALLGVALGAIVSAGWTAVRSRKGGRV